MRKRGRSRRAALRDRRGIVRCYLRANSVRTSNCIRPSSNGPIDCFETRLKLAARGLELRVVVYRKRVHHQSPKNYQLDLFSLDDGYFEYSAVATNLSLTTQALWYFAAGLARISGRKVLRCSSNSTTESLYDRIADRLAA